MVRSSCTYRWIRCHPMVGHRLVASARGTRCVQTTWYRVVDRRLRLMRELTRYHGPGESEPYHEASGDFRNMTRLASRLSSFLGEQLRPNFHHEADRSFRGWASRLRRDELLDLSFSQHMSAIWAANENPLTRSPLKHCHSTTSSLTRSEMRSHGVRPSLRPLHQHYCH